MTAQTDGVEVLTQGVGDTIWRSQNLTIQQSCSDRSKPAGCTIAFIGVDDTSQDIAESNRQSLNNSFNIPLSFWDCSHQEASGFFSTQDDISESSEIEGYTTHFRFSIKEPFSTASSVQARNGRIDYTWLKVGVFTQWHPSSGLIVFCFDVPRTMQEQLKQSLSERKLPLSLSQPFAIHVALLDQIVTSFDVAVWAWRDRVRHSEQNRATMERPEPDYMGMHEIARHVIHSSEMSDTAITVVESMLDEQSIFMAERELSRRAVSDSAQTSKAFRRHLSLSKCLHKRSRALEKRLDNEINSAFNIVAHSNSHTSVRIAEATQTDSAAMKSISFLGFAFLPATFISAIFSTQFFDFSPGPDGVPQFSVSDQFWMYWATAIPVTIAALLSWLFWQRRYRGSSRDALSFKPPNPKGHKEDMEMV